MDPMSFRFFFTGQDDTLHVQVVDKKNILIRLVNQVNYEFILTDWLWLFNEWLVDVKGYKE